MPSRDSSWADVLQLTRDEALQWVVWFPWFTDLLARLAEYLGSVCWTGHYWFVQFLESILQLLAHFNLLYLLSWVVLHQDTWFPSNATYLVLLLLWTIGVLVHHGDGRCALIYNVCLSLCPWNMLVCWLCADTQLLLIVTDWAVCHKYGHNIFFTSNEKSYVRCRIGPRPTS